jgi:hypothetical protein
MRVLPHDDGRLEVTFSATSSHDKPLHILAGLTLPCIGGRKARASRGSEARELDPLRTWSARWPQDDATGECRLRIGRVRLDVPAGASFEWPIYPVNPYAIDNAAHPEEAVGTLAIPLRPDGSAARVLVTIESEGCAA